VSAEHVAHQARACAAEHRRVASGVVVQTRKAAAAAQSGQGLIHFADLAAVAALNRQP
jgi:hypothetical protein